MASNLGKYIFLYFLLYFACPTFTDSLKKWKRATQTDGYGCDIIRLNLYRELIPNTNLYTGTFYVVTAKSKENPRSPLPFGYITYTGRPHYSGFEYVIADSHHNMEDFTEGAKWYKDCQWAFLKSRETGWYHLINCGYPNMYVTWSNLEEEDDGSGAFPMTMDLSYPGNHSTNDFLFRPVRAKGEEERVLRLETKSFGGGVVSVSSLSFKRASNHLQVESRATWNSRVAKEGKEIERNALFVFNDSKDTTINNNERKDRYRQDGYYDDTTCSCRQRILFTLLFSVWAWVTVYLIWSRRSTLTIRLLKTHDGVVENVSNAQNVIPITK